MELRELDIKNFGKISDTKIQLEDGINLIYGENESGKSTLHTFIKGMLFGIERGRGRAAAKDTFSKYEPWENPNYYAGGMTFLSGGKTFRIERNFDRYSKSVSLVCLDDGEVLSVEDGDLEMLLNGLNANSYDNTVSVKQLEVRPGQTLAAELKNYATNYYSTGNGELDLNQALLHLRERKKELERQAKKALDTTQKERESIEQEASYIWRDVHELEEKAENIREEIECRKEREEKKWSAEGHRGVMDELRPSKWRIHPIEILAFLVLIILPNFILPKPLGYMVSIILFLACGLYIWNRMKEGKKQEKTPPELMLEEIMPEEEKVSLERLKWEDEHIAEELKDKQVQYSNLQERLEELEELGDEYKEYDRKRRAVDLAMVRINELSGGVEKRMREEMNRRMSQIVCEITGGKYTKITMDANAEIGLMTEERSVNLDQVSRGTIEQVYFALRMAADDMLRAEECPVVLDDTFVYYDEERLERTLEWLYRNKKQVLIFTCQKREGQLLEQMKIPYQKIEMEK